MFGKTILDGGVGVSSHTGTVSIRRLSDGMYWDQTNDQWDGDSGEILNDLDATEGLGYFFMEALSTSNFFDSTLDGYPILCTYKISDATPTVVAHFSEMQYVRSGVSINQTEIVDSLAIIPTEDDPYPTSVLGMIKMIHELGKFSIEYDLSTYTKAVMLFYDEDRTISGDPVYWCYVYNTTGGKPASIAEIAKRDRVKIFADVEPS
jgi:hypothetical protein